ncbi:hypothetical protein EMEDMD4_910010 [Sinorhizobium medicae]|uniref:Uncharacterized protein n=1 Tax=Sinorhizobium medicae TaxID=110321 RepID=A0A508X7Q1_9HYPH|nr:hypothetical protein EMEDMD4_910010 [Sinorhizobium medicae]
MAARPRGLQRTTRVGQRVLHRADRKLTGSDVPQDMQRRLIHGAAVEQNGLSTYPSLLRRTAR